MLENPDQILAEETLIDDQDELVTYLAEMPDSLENTINIKTKKP